MLLNAHVEEVLIEGGRATGVRLRGGSTVRARKSVVSNASLWDTQRILPSHVITPKMQKESQASPRHNADAMAPGLEDPDNVQVKRCMPNSRVFFCLRPYKQRKSLHQPGNTGSCALSAGDAPEPQLHAPAPGV